MTKSPATRMVSKGSGAKIKRSVLNSMGPGTSRVIYRAALLSGMPQYALRQALSALVDSIAQEIIEARDLKVPSFGRFRLEVREVDHPMYEGRITHVYVRFRPSDLFKKVARERVLGDRARPTARFGPMADPLADALE